jgi:cytochrome c oxidase subunit 2
MSEHAHGPEHESSHPEAHEGQGVHVEKWEGIWIRISVAMVFVFILAIVISATAFGISVPGASGRMDPATLNDPENPFSQPGLRELAPGKYEAYIVAQTWSFLPNRIEVPVGSQVTFHITARDVIHGFKLSGTNVNVMALPGQVATLSATFDTPGEYNYICHEYCGYVANTPIGHHTMYGVLTVLPADAAEATPSTN